MLIWREIGVICEECMWNMSMLVCCTFLYTVLEFSSVVLAVDVNDRFRCGLARGSAAQNDSQCRLLNFRVILELLWAVPRTFWSDQFHARNLPSYFLHNPNRSPVIFYFKPEWSRIYTRPFYHGPPAHYLLRNFPAYAGLWRNFPAVCRISLFDETAVFRSRHLC